MPLKPLIDLMNKQDKLSGIYIGTVLDNEDPLMIGRIKVYIPNVHGAVPPDPKKLPWSHQIFSVGTGGSAMSVPNFIVPALEEKVLVIFPTSDIYSSFYIGQLVYEEYEFEELQVNYPNTYGFSDRLGNKYWINLEEGTIDIHHHSGTHLNINKEGAVNIQCMDRMDISAEGEIYIKSAEHIKLEAPLIDIN